MDGTGFANELVDMAFNQGIFWVNAAGNEADVHWRGRFTDSDNDTINEYFPDSQALPFIPFGPGVETQIILSWDDWQAVNQDYDLGLFDKDFQLLAKSEEPQGGEPGNVPIEGFIFEFADTEIYYLIIQNYEGNARGDATFDLFINGGLMHPDFVVAERSLSNPADARGAFAVGAVHWSDDALEPYSSNGPTADGRLKPELSAPSVVDSASYAPEAFDGTSAATPHVAGAAALVLQANPQFGPNDVAAFLQAQAIDLGPGGPDNAFGVGRLNLGQPPSQPVELTEGSAAATPVVEAEILPTSTPRPAQEAPQVGLPGQTGPGGQPGTPPPAAEDNSTLGLIVMLGLCLVCLAGLLFLVLVGVGIMFMRRK
jgi:hypothetical protein